MLGFGPLGSAPLGAIPLEIQEIDSSRWTGLATALEITEERQTKLLALIDMAMSDLELVGAGNAEKAQARAYLIALKALADAPEPPSDLIWKMLERGMIVVGACDIFYRIAEALIQ